VEVRRAPPPETYEPSAFLIIVMTPIIAGNIDPFKGIRICREMSSRMVGAWSPAA
jgi:hypothetical protein